MAFLVAECRLEGTVSVVVAHRLSCLMACGISWTRDQIHVSCIGRRILNHRATREVSLQHFWRSKLLVEPTFSVNFVFYRSRKKKKSNWEYRVPISLLSYDYLLCRCWAILCVYTWLLIISYRVCLASVSSENRYYQKAMDLLWMLESRGEASTLWG